MDDAGVERQVARARAAGSPRSARAASGRPSARPAASRRTPTTSGFSHERVEVRAERADPLERRERDDAADPQVLAGQRAEPRDFIESLLVPAVGLDDDHPLGTVELAPGGTDDRAAGPRRAMRDRARSDPRSARARRRGSRGLPPDGPVRVGVAVEHLGQHLGAVARARSAAGTPRPRSRTGSANTSCRWSTYSAIRPSRVPLIAEVVEGDEVLHHLAQADPAGVRADRDAELGAPSGRRGRSR